MALGGDMARPLTGVAYCKLGLARAGRSWREDWTRLRAQIGSGPAWVAVVYADWQHAGSPEPESVLDEAKRAGCAGLLIDTWDKSRASPLDTTSAWFALIERARGSGLLVALAGGLDADGIRRLAPLKPDLFAVRGAACSGGNRRGGIDPDRVASLAALIETIGGGRLPGASARR